jgi:lactoylglutathione lyase
MLSRAFPVFYATDVERAATFWERLGFERHYQLPPEGEPGYVGLRTGPAEVGVTNAQWATDRYGMTMGTGPRVEMYVYVSDLDGLIRQLRELGIEVLREAQDMLWGERIATVGDAEGNPVTLCQEK